MVRYLYCRHGTTISTGIPAHDRGAGCSNCVVIKFRGRYQYYSCDGKDTCQFSKRAGYDDERGHSISEYLLSYKFDYIFFTGSSKTGKYVMQSC